MKLISLHIENFGTLSDIDMDFRDGTNVILHENGWGKTTLAEFIRAMFYGIEGSRKKEFLDNDRTRFQPWNGKYFGGEMTFEVGGKKYKIERNFAEKDKDMTFKLYDAETMIESGDYSESLGEELFGVDSESFRRTCFVGTGGLRFTGINSTIGAKVSSLEQSGDLENYDVADKKMNEYLSAYSSRRKTGELYKLKNLISELKLEVKKKDSIAERIDEIKNNRMGVEAEIKALHENQGYYLELQKKNADAENLRVKNENLQSLKNDVELRKQSLDKRLGELPEEIPTHDMIEAADNKIQELLELSAQKKSLEENSDGGRERRLQSFFAAGIPDLSEIDGVIEGWNNIQNLIQKNETLEVLIETETERLASSKAEADQKKAEQSEKKRTLNIVMFVLVAICAGCVGGYIFTKMAFLLILGIAAGIAGALVPVLGGKGVSFDSVDSVSDSGQIQRYRQNIQANTNDIKNMEIAVKDFLARYEVPYSRLDAESILYDIRGKAREYLELKKDAELSVGQKEELDSRIENVSRELDALLGRMGITGTDISQIKGSLAGLTRSINAYELEVTELQKAEEKLQKYIELNPDVKAGSVPVSEAMSAEELSSKLRSLASILSEKQDLISKYDRELEAAYEEIDAISESEEKLQELESKFEELSEKYKIVEKTQDYLRQAKELFIAKYMSPIKDSFDKYYEIISGSGDTFRIDANVNLTRKEEGAFHDIEAQSEGYGDAIGISMRLALLDTMYEREKPVVILDDPFAGMDEERLAGTKKLLEEVSKNYQIIYMTCHESRTFA